MRSTNIFLTGGNGFIGKNILEQLGNKYNFYHPTHKELDLLNRDAVDNFFRSHKIDIVIHAAVIGGSRTEEYIGGMLEGNLKIFFNIVKNKKYFKKMIHFGSGAEYDKSVPIVKVKEKDFDNKVPQDEYGFFKYVCSKYIEEAGDIVCLRIFGLYGKHEDYRYRFISNAICRNIMKLPIAMNKDVYFDYIYIDDFIKILDHFITYNTSQKFYNIGTGVRINLLTIAKKINEIADNKSKIIVKNKGLNNEYTCDNSRLKKELRGIYFTDFDETLINLYNWYKSIKPSLDKDSL